MLKLILLDPVEAFFCDATSFVHSTIDGSKWTATNSVGKLKKLDPAAENNEIPVTVLRQLTFDRYFLCVYWGLLFLFAFASLLG